MSLLDAGMEACVKLDKTTENDGYGGYNIVWREGFTFDCAITFDTSMQARVADALGLVFLPLLRAMGVSCSVTQPETVPHALIVLGSTLQ